VLTVPWIALGGPGTPPDPPLATGLRPDQGLHEPAFLTLGSEGGPSID